MPTKHALVFRDFDLTCEEIEHGWEMPYSHFHSHYEIYILLSGERTVTIGEDTYAVSKGYATLFPKNVLHHSCGTTDFSGICIHFSGDFLIHYFLPSAIKELMSCFQAPVIFLPEEYRKELCSKAKSFNHDNPGNYLLLAQILHNLNIFHTKFCTGNTALNCTPSGSMQEKILNYIHQHYTVISAVSEISTVLSISEAYIYQVVKANTTMTPKQYINYLRIRHAKRELEYSNRNLPQIQEICGFHSLSYFVRVFKSQTGMTPTEFRTQRKEKERRLK
ncbi:MAG: AraC family transcriptional regulator [bacterium]|nr:AraC family transcriptional regulator [bacterium]